MHKLLVTLFAFFAWIGAAFAQAVVPVQMRNANLTTTNVQNYITTLGAFTAPRTLTIPDRSSLNAFFIQFVDTDNAISGANTLTIQASNGLINGAASITVTTAGAYIFLAPNASGYSAIINQAFPGVGGTNGQIQYNAGGAFGGFTMSGDMTVVTTTGVSTLATVNANVGSFGSATQCTAFTTNAKGLITAASQTTCTPAIASVTGLGTGVATALAINVGTAGSFITNGGALGTPSSGTLTNATGLPISTGVSGLGAGCATWLGTPTSANLRGCVTDETGTGLLYFQGGDIGTPSAGGGTNLTSLNASNISSGNLSVNRLNSGTGAGATTFWNGSSVWATAITSFQLSAGAGISVSVTAGANPCVTTCNLTVAANNSMGANKFQYLKSGSGTYTTPTNAAWVKFTLVGGGGAGAGGGTATGGTGGAGNPTCINTSGAACTTPVYQAGGGTGGNYGTGAGGAGGTISGSGTCDLGIAGGDGAAELPSNASTALSGAPGGASYLGGAGAKSFGNSAGSAGATNTGAGGQGGGSAVTGFGGPGGGSGATCIVTIQSPAASYTWAVGAASTAGTAGTSGSAGGAGGSGVIIAEAGFN